MLNVSHNEHVCSFIDILQANAEVIWKWYIYHFQVLVSIFDKDQKYLTLYV